MPRLIAALIRHAEYQQLADTPSAHQPFPLTEKGSVQAFDMASNLSEQCQSNGWEIDKQIHSSRLLRAWQTANIVAQQLGHEYIVKQFDELAERSMGSAANLTIQQVENAVLNDPRFDPLPADWKSNSEFRLPLQGAESLLQAGKRVAAHLNKNMQQLSVQTEIDTVRLFVGHGAAIRHAAYHLGVLQFDDIARLSMYHATPVYIEYTQSGWRHVAGEWKVRARDMELD